MKTFTPKKEEIERDWFVVDADGLTLGRMATEVARILRGKHKPTFAPHMDMGDHVIIVNASKVVLSSGKDAKKMVHSHSGYPGGIKEINYNEMLSKFPTRAMTKAVTGMLPHNRLGRAIAKNLRVYAGPSHPHTAQSPESHPFS